MSGAVATFTNPRLLERTGAERTEYEDAYQWRGLPEKPQDTQEDFDTANPPVDPAMYNTTTKDAYKKHDPDAYRRDMPADDGEGYEKVPVDPAMYNTTTKDAYKKYDPDAYICTNDEGPAEDEVVPLSDRASSRRAERHVGVLADGTAEAALAAGDVKSKPDPRKCRAPADLSSYESVYAKDYKPVEDAEGAVSASRAISEPSAEKPDPRKCRAPADLSSYESTYAKDYGRSDGAPASLVENSVVPPLKIPSAGKSRKNNGTARASAREPIAGRQTTGSAVPVAKAQAQASSPASAEEPAAKKALQAAPAKKSEPAAAWPRPKGSYETEYNKNYRAYSNTPTPVETPRRAQACVHHVDPAFYTTTCSAAYVAPPAAPARAAFTRPTVSVRHMDPSMYVSTARAAYV